MYDHNIGGTGIQPLEKLVRFDSSIMPIKELLNGRLSLTQGLALSDPLEAKRTEADVAATKAWWGDIAPHAMSRLEERKKLMLKTAYVSCWHRYTSPDAFDKFSIDYQKNTDQPPQYLTQTAADKIQISIPQCDGTPNWLQLFPVRYTEENQRAEELLQGEDYRSGYPELEFKRARSFSVEQEARILLHNYKAVIVNPQLELTECTERYKYISVTTESFIEVIYPLNDRSADEILRMVTDSRLNIKVIPATLKNLTSVLCV
jgi:hypothetical protein